MKIIVNLKTTKFFYAKNVNQIKPGFLFLIRGYYNHRKFLTDDSLLILYESRHYDFYYVTKVYEYDKTFLCNLIYFTVLGCNIIKDSLIIKFSSQEIQKKAINLTALLTKRLACTNCNNQNKLVENFQHCLKDI